MLFFKYKFDYYILIWLLYIMYCLVGFEGYVIGWINVVFFGEYILYFIFLGILWFNYFIWVDKELKVEKVEELKKLIWVYDRDKCD